MSADVGLGDGKWKGDALPDDFKTISDKWIEEYERDPDFVAEGMAIAFIEAVLTELQAQGKNQQWLRETIISISEPQRTRWFNRSMSASSTTNLLTVARLALAVGLMPRIVLERKGAASDGPPKERG